MSEPTDPHRTNVSAEADAALDHALRERVLDAEDLDFDDDAQTAAAVDTRGEPGDPEAEDYVLYSEVKPHLEALVALQAERDQMIGLLLYARDRVSSPAVATRMDESLAVLGITVIAPELGEVFDASRHEASATVPTEDAARHGTIAEIEQAGYCDGDRVVRHPIVTVYSVDADQR